MTLRQEIEKKVYERICKYNKKKSMYCTIDGNLYEEHKREISKIVAQAIETLIKSRVEIDEEKVWQIVHNNRIAQNDKGIVERDFHSYCRHLENLCKAIAQSKPIRIK